MTARNWLITGVSSGFGRELATQLLDCGDTVVGTAANAIILEKFRVLLAHVPARWRVRLRR